MNKLLQLELNSVLDKIEESIKEAQFHLTRKRLPAYDFMRCVIEHAKCIYVIDARGSGIPLFKNYYTGEYTSDFKAFKQLVVLAADEFNQDAKLYESDFYAMFEGLFDDASVFTQLKTLPSHYIPTTYGCYDVFNQSYMSKKEELSYYIPHRLNINLLEPIENSHIHYKIRNVLFSDWSNQNSQVNEALRFFQYCALLGYGGQHMIFLTGSAGTGKSTYEKMTINLVGNAYSQHIEAMELVRDDIAIRITPQLKLIYGKEMHSHLRINSKIMSLLKVYIEGTSWNVSRKYLPSTSIYSNAVKMQIADELPKNIRTNESIYDRSIEIDFGNVNHRVIRNERLQELTDQHVQSLINDEEFLASNVHALIHEFQFSSHEELLQKYQEIRSSLHFAQVKEIKNTKAQLLENSKVDQFLNECEMNGVFTQAKIPIKCLYEAYTQFVRKTRRKNEVLSHSRFSKKLSTFLENKGFVLDNTKLRARTIPSCQFNYREFTEGKEHFEVVHSLIPMCSNVSSILINPHPTSFLHMLFEEASQDDKQYHLLIQDMLSKNQLTEHEFFALSQKEMFELLK